MVLSRSSSLCSEKNGKFKTLQNEMPTVLSRQNVPSGSHKFTKASFPYRAIGTLSSIDVGKKQFGVLIKLEKYDPESLVQLLNDYYAKDEGDEDDAETPTKTVDPEDDAKKQYNFRKCKFIANPQVGEIYAARIDELDQIVRVRVLEKGRSSMKHTSALNQIKVHLLDYGLVTYINEGKTLKLDQHFMEEEYQTGLSLACQLPDARLLGSAPFPKLGSFKLGDHVEVYVLSDGEPCLAVLGSLASGPNIISRELFSFGMDPHGADSFHRATGMLNTEIASYKGWAPNRWLHSNYWTLVTILSSEDLANIAVRDVFTSLRFLRIQQCLNRNYKKMDFCQAMKVVADRLRSGDPVVVYCKSLSSYVRGTVTSIFHSGTGCDVEAVDIPNLTICNIPASMVYYPSSFLLDVPPLVFYVNLMKGYNCMTRADICLSAKENLVPNSVAVLKFSMDDSGAQLETHQYQRLKINDIIEDYLSCLPGDDEDFENDIQSVPHALSRTASLTDEC